MATAASTSPYVQSEGITTSIMPLSTVGPFDDGLFGPTLDLSVSLVAQRLLGINIATVGREG